MDTKKLRQKILDLAIRGKLVPQDPNDEPASVLLERIRAEKEQLIKEGKIKCSKKSAASDTSHYENVPFEVPDGWVWCRLDDLAFYKKGPFGSSLTKSMFIPDNGKAYKVYEQKNAIQKNASLGHYFISGEKFQELKGFEVLPNDIIVSCAGTIGETYIMPSDIRSGIINQALMIIRLYDIDITSFYLLYFDYILKNKAGKDGKGTAIKNIPPFDILKNYMIPLPPLREQIRIINEVTFWQNFIDSIDSNCGNISALCKRTKSKVLDLAISGKLLPQDNNDEPAINHLKKINPDYKTADNRHYRKIPDSWEICRLKDIFNITMGQSPDGETINSTSGIEFHQGKINFTDRYLSESGVFTNAPTKIALPDSLLLCVRAPVGVINITKRKLCIGRGLCSLHPKYDIDCLFWLYVLGHYKHYFEENATGTTFKAISGDVIKNLAIPFPPIAEQNRILAKINELYGTLDKIAAEL